ncbi:MAG TPA: 50S ribosomal protein L29 [bacterium]|nr:50S ribosomal protein L29 [bacterium]
MKTREIRDMNPDEIERKLRELKETLFKAGIKIKTKQAENTSQLKIVRKDIARLLTVLKQKKQGTEAANGTKK